MKFTPQKGKLYPMKDKTQTTSKKKDSLGKGVFLALMSGFILMAASLFLACQTSEVEVSDETSAEKIIQLGQEASGANRYIEAKAYYETLIERYGSNIQYMVVGTYEIALINQKQNNLKEARQGYNEVLGYYEDSAQAALLPEWPRVLADKKLKEIESEEE